jgi:curved DNA-binding protein
MQINNCYRTLEVKQNASANEIRQSYRRLAHKYHPDISTHLNSDHLFQEISEAYAGIKNLYKNSTYLPWQEPIKRINFDVLDSLRK